MEKSIREQLSILVHLAMSDDQFTETEKNTIRKIASEKGVAELEIDLLFKDNEVSDKVKLSHDHKVDLLLNMIYVLLSDKEIHPSEEAFAKNMAHKLGFKESVITFLIDYNTMDATVLKEMVIPYLEK